MKRHVFAQREKIPARPMISSGHSCSPHHHCKGIVLGLSCPARPPTLQPLASLTASPLSCLSATPRLCWLMGECEGMGPGMGLPLFSNETIARTVFISHFIFLSSFNGGVCSPTDNLQGDVYRSAEEFNHKFVFASFDSHLESVMRALTLQLHHIFSSGNTFLWRRSSFTTSKCI